MITYTELRRISLDFRRLSSNFLNSVADNSDVMIQRFKKYIDETPCIAEIITNTITGVDYDWQSCFRKSDHSGWWEVDIPVDEPCHIKAMYDYLGYLISHGPHVLGNALNYYHSQNKYDDIIQHFLDIAFKPLIDYINDSISKEMIILEDQKHPTLTQNIGVVNGTVNQQGSGTINSETTVFAENAEQIVTIEKQIEKLLPHLADIPDIPEDALDDVRDDLESVKEQIKASEPKKTRLQKALSGIKGFFDKFTVQLASSLAVHAITQTDWTSMISAVETLIANL